MSTDKINTMIRVLTDCSKAHLCGSHMSILLYLDSVVTGTTDDYEINCTLAHTTVGRCFVKLRKRGLIKVISKGGWYKKYALTEHGQMVADDLKRGLGI